MELEVFMEYLDYAVPSPEDEFTTPESSQGRNRSITFIENVGRRYITVLERERHHYRLDKQLDKNKTTQKWTCRWAQKFTCKSQIILTLAEDRSLYNYISGELRGTHTHPPQPLNISIPRPSTLEIDARKDPSPSSSRYSEQSTPDWAIINSADLSTDFGANAMATHPQSSPLSQDQHPRRDGSPRTSTLPITNESLLEMSRGRNDH